VSVLNSGRIATTGDYAFGIFAQSIGGGGGLGGDSTGAFAGSNGNLDPSGKSGDLYIEVEGTLSATGAEAIGIFAQSDSGQINGNIVLVVGGAVSGGSGQQGAGIRVDEGSDNNQLTIAAGGSVSALSGNAVVYSGGGTLTTVNAGTIEGNVHLRNDFGRLGRLDNRGTLVGGPRLDAHVTNSGHLLVGQGPGVFGATRIGGDFTQTAAGRLRIDADLAANRADLLSVDGRAVLAGGLDLDLLALRPGCAAQVLTAAGGLVGALEDPAGTALVDLALERRGDALWLTVQGADFDPGGLDPSQAAVAGHLQQIWDAGGDPAFDAFFATLDRLAASGGYGAALSDLSPGAALGPAARSGPALRGFTNSLMSCPAFEGDGALPGEGQCGWVRLGWRATVQSAYRGVSGLDDDRRSVQAGGQLEVAPGWFVGGSALYEETRLRGDDGRVTSDGEGVAFGISVKHVRGPWLLAAGLGTGSGWYDTERGIGIPGFAGLAEGRPRVQGLGARLRAAYAWTDQTRYFRPSLDLDLVATRAPGYSESGAGALDLVYQDAEQTTVAVTPALEVGARIDLGGGYVLRPFARVGVSLLSNADWSVAARLRGAPAGVGTFDTTLPLDDTVGRIGAGVQLYSASGLELRLLYDGEFSEHVESHAGSLVASIPF
jgi:uncharacterized protein YhjY with autotransporter beta-barrel domain